jgi:hypothetical protein
MLMPGEAISSTFGASVPSDLEVFLAVKRCKPFSKKRPTLSSSLMKRLTNLMVKSGVRVDVSNFNLEGIYASIGSCSQASRWSGKFVWLLKVEVQVCHEKAGMRVVMKAVRTKERKQAFCKVERH